MSRKTSQDTDGAGILQSGSGWEGQAVSLARWFAKWDGTQGQEYHLRSVTLYPPKATKSGQWMVVGKGWNGGYRLVAFHRSTDGFRALLGFFERWWTGKLDWKADSYQD